MSGWKRHKDGDGSTAWTKTIGETNVVVINMQGQSVAFSGVGAHTLIWTSEKPGDPFATDRREVHRTWSVSSAKHWAEKTYGNSKEGT